MKQGQSAPAHAILAAIGTDGDIYPLLALGETLRARGYRVTLASHEHIGPKALAAGLSFRVLVSHAETEVLLQAPNLWNPYKGPTVIARWGAQLLERHYRQLAKLAEEPNSFLVAGIGVIAARVVQEKHGISLASVVLQPWSISSNEAPPTMMPGVTLPGWTPRPLKNLYWRGFDYVGWWLMGRELNELRTTLGLAPIRRLFHWWYSPQLVVGLFPDWYGPPQRDWPSQLRLVGFPAGHRHRALDPNAEVVRFCEAGAPPVAFTFGTGMRHAGKHFEAAATACQSLGMLGIFITRTADQLPKPLPDSIHHCSFAPFRNLFPRCSAVVHHGGIGTTADALASGTPQLILPFAFDQFDNAARVRRLGAGDFLGLGKRSAAQIAAKLGKILAGDAARRPPNLWGKPQPGDGLERAADLLIALHR